MDKKDLITNSNRSVLEFWELIKNRKVNRTDFYLSEIKSNREKAEKNYNRSYYIIVILSVIFYLLYQGEISKISFLGVSIENDLILRWFLVVGISYFMYFGVFNFMLESAYANYYHGLVEVENSEIFNSGLSSILLSPSMINFERISSGLSNSKLITRFFGITVLTIFLLFPFALWVLLVYLNTTDEKILDFGLISIVCLSISVLFFLRIITFILQVISSIIKQHLENKKIHKESNNAESGYKS